MNSLMAANSAMELTLSFCEVPEFVTRWFLLRTTVEITQKNATEYLYWGTGITQESHEITWKHMESHGISWEAHGRCRGWTSC